MKKIINIIMVLFLVIAAIPLAANAEEETQILDHVVISPVTAVVPVGETQQFTAYGQDAADVAIPGLSYVWSVSAGGVIDSTGLFTAGDVTGTYTDTIQVTVVQSAIEKTAHATVIIPSQLDHVVISPTTTTIEIGETQQFTAYGHDAAHVTIPGLSYVWSVSAGGVIDGTGLFTAGDVTGTYTDTIQVTVVQSAIEKTAHATVIIPGQLDHVVISPTTTTIEIGETQQFTAYGQDAADVTIPGLSYVWSVSAGGVIDSTGLFTAGDVTGTYTAAVQVSVTHGGVTKLAQATVIIEDEDSVPNGWSQGNKNGWGEDDSPRGWSKGNKTGWGGLSTPPGWDKIKEGFQEIRARIGKHLGGADS